MGQIILYLCAVKSCFKSVNRYLNKYLNREEYICMLPYLLLAQKKYSEEKTICKKARTSLVYS